MIEMQEFSLFLLQAIAEFLGTEPVFYLFGVVIFCFICKAIKNFIS